MTTTLCSEIDRDALAHVVGSDGVLEYVSRKYAGLMREDYDSMTCLGKSKVLDGIGRFAGIAGVTAAGYVLGKLKTGRVGGGYWGGLIGNLTGNVGENMLATKGFLVNSRECAK